MNKKMKNEITSGKKIYSGNDNNVYVDLSHHGH